MQPDNVATKISSILVRYPCVRSRVTCRILRDCYPTCFHPLSPECGEHFLTVSILRRLDFQCDTLFFCDHHLVLKNMSELDSRKSDLRDVSAYEARFRVMPHAILRCARRGPKVIVFIGCMVPAEPQSLHIEISPRSVKLQYMDAR